MADEGEQPAPEEVPAVDSAEPEKAEAQAPPPADALKESPPESAAVPIEDAEPRKSAAEPRKSAAEPRKSEAEPRKSEAVPSKVKSEVHVDKEPSAVTIEGTVSAEMVVSTTDTGDVKTGDEARKKSRVSGVRDELGVRKSLKKSSLSLGERRMSRIEETRRSTAKRALGSIIDIRRTSYAGEVLDKKAPRYMNTYKMDSDNPFNSDKVDKILKSVMIEALENLTYDPDKCPKQAKWASMSIRAKVKGMDFDRYKIVCVVTIGEKHSQDMFVACRFLWDAEKDRYSTFSMENTYVFGIAQCFGLYYE